MRNTNLKSRQCISCQFYFYCKLIFKYETNICDGCFHCMQYEKKNYPAIFRILETKKGTFRTISSYFLFKSKNYSKIHT